AHRAAGDIAPAVADHAHHLAEGERRQREVMAAQAQRRQAEQRGEQAAEHEGRNHAEPGRDAEVDQQQGRDIGAGAEESRMAERDQAREAGGNVPGLRQRREQQDQAGDAQAVALLGQQPGQDERHEQRQSPADPAAAGGGRIGRASIEGLLAHFCLRSPSGRRASTRMKTTNSTRFCNWIGNTSVDIVWITPTASPPITAPSTLPRPPSTTAVNISTTNCPPIVGEAVKYGRITAPPSAVMATPRPNAIWRMRRTSMPRLSAAAASCEAARIAWPSQVKRMKAHSRTPATSDTAKASR